MAEIGLVEAIAQVREELARAVTAGAQADIQFPVGQVTLEFKVGMTKTGEGAGKVKLWVLELGATGKYAQESVQTISVVLEPPVDSEGRPIKVSAGSQEMPG